MERRIVGRTISIRVAQGHQAPKQKIQSREALQAGVNEVRIGTAMGPGTVNRSELDGGEMARRVSFGWGQIRVTRPVVETL